MIRIGVDFGGTKIEAAAIDRRGNLLARWRTPSPGSYEAAIQAVVDLVEDVERVANGRAARIGVGGPGSISPSTGLMRNANSLHLNHRPFVEDLAKALGRPVRYANDANCLAVSEATDGAGADGRVVFAAILGTGCGGGLAVDKQVVRGANAIAGEWGHVPLPWPRDDEYPAPRCWCGQRGCLELWISGSGLARAFGQGVTAETIVAGARAGGQAEIQALADHRDRLGRALAMICNILDPDVIVLGGGLSNVDEITHDLAAAIAPYVFSESFRTPVRRAVHGDSSGVRGAAWLWPDEP